MKQSKIALFFIVVISVLVVISIVFPAKGIKIGTIELQFPKPEEFANRDKISDLDPEKILESQKLKKIDSLKHELSDTINYYLGAMVHPTRFYLPNDDYNYFDPFFKQAESAKNNNKIVRVIHYGDSQIELDRISSNLRTFFQSEFGGSGPGMLPLYQSIPTSTVYQNFSGSYTTYALYGDGIRHSKREYGVMAKTFKITGYGAFYASAPGGNKDNPKRRLYSKIRLLYSNQNDPLKASLSSKSNNIFIEQENPESGIQMMEWQLDTAISNFNLQLNGNANIYGVLIDGGPGVAVDNIPMRGASGTFFTQMNDSLLRETYRKIDVGLIILQFGGNSVPGLYNEKSADQYVQQLVSQIRFFRRNFPHIPILFIGPSDMSTREKGVMTTYPILPYLIDKLKVEIPANGAAFWNMYEVMGGKNSMLSWVKKGWAGSDHVHFSTQGAHNIGSILVQSFSTMHDFYHIRKEHPAASFNEVFSSLKKQHHSTTLTK